MYEFPEEDSGTFAGRFSEWKEMPGTGATSTMYILSGV